LSAWATCRSRNGNRKAGPNSRIFDARTCPRGGLKAPRTKRTKTIQLADRFSRGSRFGHGPRQAPPRPAPTSVGSRMVYQVLVVAGSELHLHLGKRDFFRPHSRFWPPIHLIAPGIHGRRPRFRFTFPIESTGNGPFQASYTVKPKEVHSQEGRGLNRVLLGDAKADPARVGYTVCRSPAANPPKKIPRARRDAARTRRHRRRLNGLPAPRRSPSAQRRPEKDSLQKAGESTWSDESIRRRPDSTR